MKKTDRELGMLRQISRRDFVHGVSLGALGLMLPLGCSSGTCRALFR